MIKGFSLSTLNMTTIARSAINKKARLELNSLLIKFNRDTIKVPIPGEREE